MLKLAPLPLPLDEVDEDRLLAADVEDEDAGEAEEGADVTLGEVVDEDFFVRFAKILDLECCC